MILSSLNGLPGSAQTHVVLKKVVDVGCITLVAVFEGDEITRHLVKQLDISGKAIGPSDLE